MSRQNQILAVLLLLQLALIGLVFWPRPATVNPGGDLFAGLEAGQLTRLTISDATGQQVQLAKTAAGWVLSQADDYPAQADRVSTLIAKIIALKTDRLVAQTSASHKRLQVAGQDFVRLIEFELSNGARHKLYLGTAGGGQTIHVRADDSEQVYLVSGLSATDAAVQASGWVNTTYFSVPQDQIVALTLENPQGRFEFEKTADGWTWKDVAAGEQVNTSAITSLVNRAASISMIQPLGKTGALTPKATVTLKTRDANGTERVYTLQVGDQGPEGYYTVRSSESPYYVQVAAWGVQDFVEKGRQDFQLSPTPTPTP